MTNQKRFALPEILVAVLLFGFLLGVRLQWPISAHAEEYWTEAPKQRTTASTPSIDINALNSVFSSLAERVSPSVVNIYTKTKFKYQFGGLNGGSEDVFRYFFGNPFDQRLMMPPVSQEAQTLGSGFIINKDGYIVTNSHVIRPMQGRVADEIMIKFINEDQGKGYPATVVGFDEKSDVALLKLKTKKDNLAVAPFGNSDVSKVGEWVVAIGNPYGHAHTVTQGIVSAKGRNLENSAAEFIQTSASINPGNSGGPLFNLNGEVIGINTAIDPRAQGIGFAIPINFAKPVIQDLIQDGKVRHGWIGLAISTVTPDMADALGLSESQGVIVRQVVKDSPAERAGLKRGDIVTKVKGEVVSGQEKLIQIISSSKVGENVPIELSRRGKQMTLKVEIGEEPVNIQMQSRNGFPVQRWSENED